MFEECHIAKGAMRCYNHNMLLNELSITSYINGLVEQDMSLDINSADGQKEISQLLNNTVLVGGKRLRPLLTTLFGKSRG